MLPSVTTSARRFSRIGVTLVIGSTPVTSTSFSCFHEAKDAGQLTAPARQVGLLHPDAGQLAHLAGGVDVNGHRALLDRFGLV
jgi:hypothetical protein